MNTMTGAAFRGAIFGLAAVALSLPLLFAAHRALGLGTPPMGGMLLLGGGVVFAWATGALGGALLGDAARHGRFGAAPIIGLLGGLLWGGVLCAILAPMYGQSVLEGLAREGAAAAWGERDALLHRQLNTGRALDTAKALAVSGAARGSSLLLLVWVLLGPAFSGAWEARKASRR